MSDPTGMTASRAIRVPAQQLCQAVLLHVQTECKAKGISVPESLIDLLNRGRVYFVGPEGVAGSPAQPVEVSAAHVLWEE